MTTVELAFRIAVFLPVGLVFGSFLTVVVHRVPAGESLLRPRSRCPACGTPLRNRDNVPVVSWLVLRGRCHACGARIPVVYPLTELATGALFVTAGLVHEPWWAAALIAPFLGVMLALAVIDIRTKTLPNRIVYPSLIAVTVYLVLARLAVSGVDVVGAAIGFLAYGGFLLVVAFISPRGMGIGDVKLAGLIGLTLGSLGLEMVAVAAGLGILFGGVGAIVALIRGADRKHALPYGPFLALGAVAAALLGLQVAALYLDVVT